MAKKIIVTDRAPRRIVDITKSRKISAETVAKALGAKIVGTSRRAPLTPIGLIALGERASRMLTQPGERSVLEGLDEAVRFGEENDLGDYLDGMPEGRFEVMHRRLRIDRELYRDLDALSHTRGTTPDELANTWLREKLQAEKSVRS